MLEYEPMSCRMGVAGKGLKPPSLVLVPTCVSVGVVTYQCLRKSRCDFFDVPPEIGAVFEVELILSALFHGSACYYALFSGVGKDL